MSVNLEVKGTLAKLLATEDLIIEHKSVQTASFNVNTRVLTLPHWSEASNTVADLLVAHEVGHALFTPNEDWTKKVSCPQMFVGVTEDARIENQMKRKFSGLPKTFYRGYKELYDEDFFGVADDNLDTLQIADRVNLHFKVGRFLMVKFTPEEQVVVDQIASAETFDDALKAADALYALHKKQREDASQSAPSLEQPSEDNDGEQPQSDSGNSPAEDDQENSGGSGEDPGNSNSNGRGSDTEEVETQEDGDGESESPNSESHSSGGDYSDSVKTMESLEDNLRDLTHPSSYGDPEYFGIPTMKKDVVISTDRVHKYLNHSWNSTYEHVLDSRGEEDADVWWEHNIGRHHKKFETFRRDIQQEVNYLIKEFESKKAATAYARATTSRTGVLDCTKLHTYKYNDDLFKKVTSLPEGKNHGLVFVIDWSGSMCKILEDTVKQLLSLVMFCDKVDIPFQVFAFTNEWSATRAHSETYDEAGVFHIPSTFSMLTLLNSDVPRKQLYKQMSNVYAMASMFSADYGSYIPKKLFLSGTPLNEALVSLYTILPQFKAKTDTEKTHVIVLTDGEAGGSTYTIPSTMNGEYFIRPRRLSWGGSNSYLRNRHTGIVRSMRERTTKTIIEDLRDTFPNSSFTGFRICEGGSGHWIRHSTNYDEKIIATWKKEKCVTITNQGYSKQYVIAASKLNEDVDFNVVDGATKSAIKSAFTKSLKNKKTNKKILSDFIGEIA